MHILLKSKQRITDEYFRQHDTIRLPSACRTTMMNIENDSDESQLNCCQHLMVYDDMAELLKGKLCVSLDENDSTNSQIQQYSDKLHDRSTNDTDTNETCSKYYECSIIVKGFKNQLVKGQSIWTQ